MLGWRRGGTPGSVFRFGQSRNAPKSGIQKTNFFRLRKPYWRRSDVMKSVCRKIGSTAWRRRQLAMTELLRNARVVTDANKLARLKAQVARLEPGSEGDILHVNC